MMSLFDLYDSEGNVVPFEDRHFDAEDVEIMKSGTGIDYSRSIMHNEPISKKPVFTTLIQPKENLSKSEQSVQVSNSNADVSQSKPEVPVKKNIDVDLSGIQADHNSEVFDHNI